jgi:hypothetical protein
LLTRLQTWLTWAILVKNKQQIISVKNEEPGSLAITILPQKGIGLVQNTFDVYRGSGS